MFVVDELLPNETLLTSLVKNDDEPVQFAVVVSQTLFVAAVQNTLFVVRLTSRSSEPTLFCSVKP